MRMSFGVTEEEFRANFLSRKPILGKYCTSGTLMGTSDLDKMLYEIEPQAPEFSIHNGAGPLNEGEFTESYIELGIQKRRIEKKKFYKLMKDGATAIMNRIDSRSMLVKQLCMDVSRYVSQPVLANGYFCIGKKPSFGYHWDTHDVFAVQLIGKKHWLLHPPTLEVPVPRQASRNYAFDNPSGKQPFLDVVLNEGDVLYIPRGWWHCVTGVGVPTFHVSIGVHAPNVKDYIAWVCANLLPFEREFRESISMDDNGFTAVCAAVGKVSDVLCKKEYFDKYVDKIMESERQKLPFSLAEELLSLAEDCTSAEIRLGTVYTEKYVRRSAAGTPALPTDPIELEIFKIAAVERDVPILGLHERLGYERSKVDFAIRSLAAQDFIFFR